MIYLICIQEREAQVEINHRKKEIEKIIDQKYLELDKEKLKLAEENDIRKKIEEEENKVEQKKILKQQNQESKVKYLKKLQEEKMEGEIIKKKAIEDIAKQKIEEEKKRQKQKNLQSEIKLGNEVTKV